MSDKLKVDSENESSRRSSPRQLESQTYQYQAALFRGGGHWSAASSACGDIKNECDENLDQTVRPTPLDNGDREKEDPEEGHTSIEADVLCVKIVKVRSCFLNRLKRAISLPNKITMYSNTCAK